MSEPENTNTTRRDARGRWLPGSSGNYGGRPRSAGIREAILEAWSEVDPETPRSKLRGMIDAMIRAASRGNVAAFSALMDRVEGKPRHPIDSTVRTVSEDELAQIVDTCVSSGMTYSELKALSSDPDELLSMTEDE